MAELYVSMQEIQQVLCSKSDVMKDCLTGLSNTAVSPIENRVAVHVSVYSTPSGSTYTLPIAKHISNVSASKIIKSSSRNRNLV